MDNTLNCNVAEGTEAGALAAEDEEGTAVVFAEEAGGTAVAAPTGAEAALMPLSL
jgi:hypothetical protein